MTRKRIRRLFAKRNARKRPTGRTRRSMRPVAIQLALEARERYKREQEHAGMLRAEQRRHSAHALAVRRNIYPHNPRNAFFAMFEPR